MKTLALVLVLVSPWFTSVALADATLTLAPAGPVAAGDDLGLSVGYSLQGASAGDVLTLDLPPNVAVAAFQPPTDDHGKPSFTGGCTNVNFSLPWDSACQFVFIGGTSSSGTIEITLRTARFGFKEGTTPVSIVASFVSTSAGAAEVSGSIDVTATAKLDIWSSHFSLNTMQVSSYKPPGFAQAVSGRLIMLTTLYYDAGEAPIASLQHGMKLPSHAYYVGSNAPVGKTKIVTAPDPALPGQTITYGLNRDIGEPVAIDDHGNAYSGGQIYGDAIFTYYFISCADLAAIYDVNGQVIAGEEQWPIMFNASGVVPLTAGGTRPETDVYEFNTNGYSLQCNNPGAVNKGHDVPGDRASGEIISMNFNIAPPDLVPVPEVIAIDALPKNVALMSTEVYSGGFTSAFTLYFCHLPDLAEVVFPSADFLNATNTSGSPYRNDSTRCMTQASFLAPGNNASWSIGQTTHLVFYAPSWVDSGVAGPTALQLYGRSLGRIDPNAKANDTVTNRLRGESMVPGVFSRPMATDTFHIDNSINHHFVGLSSGSTPIYTNTWNPGTAQAPTKFVLRTSFWRTFGALLENPEILVTLPPGIEPDFTFQAGAGFYIWLDDCPGGPSPTTVPTTQWLRDTKNTASLLDDQWSIRMDFQPVGGEWKSQGCNASDFTHTAFVQVMLTPGYPFVTGVPNIATATLTIDNAGTQPITSEYSAFVSMPKEMRITTSQSCGDGPAQPQIVAGYENSAGTDLDSVVVIVPIPKVGSPSGTEVDTVFVGMTPPDVYTDGYTQDYSTDGGFNWINISQVGGHEAAVTHVRTVLYKLDAYSKGSFGVTLAHATPGDLGNIITFTATIAATGLTPVSVVAPTEYVVGACPARVKVTKLFASDDPKGGGPLVDWTFIATGDGGLADTNTSVANGETTLYLPPGSYEISEVIPDSSPVVWTPVSPSGGTTEIVVGWDDEYELTFTNSCTCDNDSLCTHYSCVYPGVCQPTGKTVCDKPPVCNGGPGTCDDQLGCVYQPLSGDKCSDDDLCTSSDICVAGVCEGQPIVCKALDACHDDGECQAQTGLCSNPAKPEGATCDDGVACSFAECQSGQCNPIATPQITVYLFTDDDGDTILAAGVAPEPPPALASGAYIRWKVVTAGTIANLPSVGSDIQDVLSATEDLCAKPIAELVHVYAPPPCEPGVANTFSLPDADLGLSALVCGDVSGNIHDIAGALAVAGAAKLSSFSVGLGIEGPGGDDHLQDPGEPGGVLFVNGAFTGTDGEVYGNAYWQTSFDTTSVTLLEGGVDNEGDPLDLSFMCFDLRAVSLALGSAQPTAVPELQWWDGEVLLKGTDPVLNVFEVDGSDAIFLPPTTAFIVDVPAGSQVLLNIRGAATTIAHGEFWLGTGVAPEDVLFNFPEALAIRMDAFPMRGSILAPWATLDFTNGYVDGTVVVAVLTGDVELHLHPLSSSLTVTPDCDLSAPANDSLPDFGPSPDVVYGTRPGVPP